MTLDPETGDVYEREAAAWTTARVTSDLSPAIRIVERGATQPILDLGCGPGYHLAALPSGAVGLEPVSSMLRIAAARLPKATLVRGEAGHLPFCDGSLGGVVASKVLVHIERRSLPMVLGELHRVLCVDAPVEIVMFGGDQDLTATDTGPFAGRRYALWDEGPLTDVLIGAGFGVESFMVESEDEDEDEEATERWPRLSISARRLRTLPDTVAAGMRLLICGLNPSLHSADMGVGFGRGGNRFWPAAMQAGVVTIDRDPRHALEHHGIGMTDLVKRATRRADALDPDEYIAGLARLERLCGWLRPAAVCMVGLAGWRAATDRKATVGWQERALGGSPVYVMPSTSGLNAHAQLPDLTEHLRGALR